MRGSTISIAPQATSRQPARASPLLLPLVDVGRPRVVRDGGVADGPDRLATRHALPERDAARAEMREEVAARRGGDVDREAVRAAWAAALTRVVPGEPVDDPVLRSEHDRARM